MAAKTPTIPAALRSARQTKHNSQAPAKNKTVGAPIQNCNAPSQPDRAASPRQP